LALAIAMCGTSLAWAGFNEDYNQALNTFRSAKTPADYKNAADLFGALIARKDAGDLFGNCLYWQAEAWFGLKEYAKALNAFEKALLYPQPNKEEACRYKVAVCCIRLGWIEEARWELTRFLRDYPRSEWVVAAKRELDKLPANGK